MSDDQGGNIVAPPHYDELLELDAARRERIIELMSLMSPQQVAFVFQFIKTLNPTQAALQTGYGKGDPRKAATSAHAVMQNPAVKDMIALLMETQITKEEVVARLVDIVRFDYGDLLVEDENGRTSFDMAKAKEIGATQFVKSYRYGRQGSSVEVYDKLAALTLLAKFLGMLTEKVETNTQGFKVLVEHVKKEITPD